MSKFPLWKYLLILIAVVAGFIYTIPNFYGEVPAVQISSLRSSLVITPETISDIESELKLSGIAATGQVFDGKTLKLKFTNTDIQLKARDAIQQVLGDNYVVALNLISASPDWLSSINAGPMFLGLDLRGGVHFL